MAATTRNRDLYPRTFLYDDIPTVAFLRTGFELPVTLHQEERNSFYLSTQPQSPHIHAVASGQARPAGRHAPQLPLAPPALATRCRRAVGFRLRRHGCGLSGLLFASCFVKTF